jgi:hypothetical protein
MAASGVVAHLRQIDPHTELARPLPRNGAVVRDVRNARPLSSALAKARVLAEREAENECTLRCLANNERAAHPGEVAASLLLATALGAR